MIRNILTNLSVMVLTVVVVLAGFYLLLKCLDWGLRIKSGRREQEGLTDLWLSTQVKRSPEPPPVDVTRSAETPEPPESQADR